MYIGGGASPLRRRSSDIRGRLSSCGWKSCNIRNPSLRPNNKLAISNAVWRHSSLNSSPIRPQSFSNPASIGLNPSIHSSWNPSRALLHLIPHPFGPHSQSIRASFSIHSGLILHPFGPHSSSILASFGTDPGLIWDSFWPHFELKRRAKSVHRLFFMPLIDIYYFDWESDWPFHFVLDQIMIVRMNVFFFIPNAFWALSIIIDRYLSRYRLRYLLFRSLSR